MFGREQRRLHNERLARLLAEVEHVCVQQQELFRRQDLVMAQYEHLAGLLGRLMGDQVHGHEIVDGVVQSTYRTVSPSSAPQGPHELGGPDGVQ